MSADRLPINEVFETLQGEATYTGTPSLFIRLQGCGVGCPWCDTKHTWRLDPRDEISAEAMAAKVEDGQSYAGLTVDELVALALSYRARHVVITGGEPCAYDLAPFTKALLRVGRTVQVETSGTQEIRVADGVWVTLSPKIDMPGGFSVREDAMQRADEIKMPVGKPADMEKLAGLLGSCDGLKADVWLQPLSRSPKATTYCIEQATALGYRVSIQTHAFIGVR